MNKGRRLPGVYNRLTNANMAANGNHMDCRLGNKLGPIHR